MKSALLPVSVCKPENCQVATGGQYEPRSSFTKAWNPSVILSPAEFMFYSEQQSIEQSSFFQLIVKGSMWLCPLCVRREYNLQLSAVQSHHKADGKKYLCRATWKTSSPSSSISLTLFYSASEPRETWVFWSPCFPPFRIVYIEWQLGMLS